LSSLPSCHGASLLPPIRSRPLRAWLRRLSSTTLLLALVCGCAEDDTGDPAPQPTTELQGTHDVVQPTAEVPTTPRTLLLVTFDTTRADHLGSYGRTEAVTPVTDRLASEGLLFERAYAPAPITLPSHASILTGVLPAVHGVRDNGQYILGEEAVLVSEVLEQQQWRTAAFVSSFVLDESFGLGQGFGHYSGAATSNLGGQAHANERSARSVVDDALSWAAAASPADDLFLWVHFYDPHWPYISPPDWTGSAYDGEIARCDQQLGRLLAGLDDLQRTPGLTTVVTADHGESLGERGELSHGVFVYESAVRVPLIVSGAGLGGEPGARLPEPVSIAAIAPTLLALAGLDPSELPHCETPALIHADGTPQAGEASRPLLLETWYPYNSYRWHPLQSLVWNGHKLIRGAALELYDLNADPAEQTELTGAQPELTALMSAQLDQTLAAATTVDWAAQRTLTADELANLRSLGYAGGGPSLEGSLSDGLPDGRELIGDTKSLDKVRTLLTDVQGLLVQPPTNDQRVMADRSARARAWLVRCRGLLQPLQEGHPANPMAASYRGTVEAALGEAAAAIPHLELAVRANPRDPALRFTLGESYQQTGRLDDACQQMLATLTIEPRYTAALNWMTWYRSQQGQLGQAVWWAETLIAIIPEADPGRAAFVSALNGLRAEMTESGQSMAPDNAYPLDPLPLPLNP